MTGCSSGLGAAFANEILSQGFRLVATARKVESLSYLPDEPERVLKLPVDVTVVPQIAAAIDKAVSTFGRVDAVINNAGYGLMGEVEATSEASARKLLDTNFFGSAFTTKAALRIMREINLPAGSGGVIIQISSMGGLIAFPGNAYYHAAKFALEGFTEAASKEMLPEWNIDFLIVEPGGVQTDYAGRSMVVEESLPAYQVPEHPVTQLKAYVADDSALHEHWARPQDVAKIVISMVARRGDKPLPLHLPLGSDAYGLIQAKAQQFIKELEDIREVSLSVSSPEQMKSVDFLKS